MIGKCRICKTEVYALWGENQLLFYNAFLCSKCKVKYTYTNYVTLWCHRNWKYLISRFKCWKCRYCIAEGWSLALTGGQVISLKFHCFLKEYNWRCQYFKETQDYAEFRTRLERYYKDGTLKKTISLNDFSIFLSLVPLEKIKHDQ